MGDELDPVVTSIEEMLRPLKPLSTDCCIYKVPENLRKVNGDAYCPVVVSIGPYFYNHSKLQAMQDHKLRYLQYFLQRNVDCDMKFYVQYIRGRQQDVRNRYLDQIHLDDDTFVKMVLMDAAFIIELFLRRCSPSNNLTKTDYICGNNWMRLLVTRDIRLIENQLPFFIINELYKLALPSNSNEVFSFIHLTYMFFSGKLNPLPPRIASADIKHFVDFLRVYHLPSVLRRDGNCGDLIDIDKTVQGKVASIDMSERTNRSEHPSSDETYAFSPTVSDLSEAGVKFRVKDSDNLLDISFTDGVLEIPKLRVADFTESLFRNLIVFEQWYHYMDSYIVDYFRLMDDLINTPKDVEILIQNDILVDWLGSSDDMASFFNNMIKQTIFRSNNFYYSSLCRNMNAFVNSRWHRWKAILKHKYFNHPWAAISVFYAIIILIMTIIQAATGFD